MDPRLPTLDAESRLALALKNSLLTKETSLIVVHARAEGEKAQTLPALQKVAQMHAAGWGGVGRKVVSRLGSRSVSSNLATIFTAQKIAEPWDAIGLDRLAWTDISDAAPVAQYNAVEAFTKALDTHFSATGFRTLPASLADLDRLGLDRELRRELADCIAAGNDVDIVIRAFLDALLPWATKLRRSRQLLRALRHQFKQPGEHRQVRVEVAVMMG